MAADIATTLNAWSSTSSSNQPDTSDPVGPNTLAQNLQVIQSVMRAASAGDGTIASATTTDLSTVNDGDITVSGTTTITGFGTLTAGIKKILTFSGALTLTHNATSLILPGSANITTAAGDVAIMRSLGAGNWKCMIYQRAANVYAASGANADITSMTALTAPTVATNPLRATDLQSQLVTAFTTGGTGTAFTLTPAPAITAYVANQEWDISFSAACGASPTLQISGVATPPNLVKQNTNGTYSNLSAGDFPSGWQSKVKMVSTTQALVRSLPVKKGTSTNDAATTGDIGEYVESVAGPVSAPASNTYGDLTSITLTAGDWDISSTQVSIINTGVSITSVVGGIGTVSGSSGAGMVNGDTQGYSVPPTSQYLPAITIPPKRVSINATTTYYLKMWMSYSSGTPQFQGRISARRVR